MMFLTFKWLHLVAMVCWFAVLFYLPRLFVYHAQAQADKDEKGCERFVVMERKLYRAIGMPAMIATLIFGFAMVSLNAGGYFSSGWFHAKLLLIVLLIGYHHICGAMLKRFARGENQRSHVFFRWFNEVPVIFLLAVIFLAVFKPF